MLRTRLVVAVCYTAFFLFIGPAPFCVAETDYNKEFSDNYFRLKEQDADLHIRVYRKWPQTKVDSIGKQDKIPATKKKEEKESGLSISALGKFLQISLVILLGILIYTLAQRSKKKNRY